MTTGARTRLSLRDERADALARLIDRAPAGTLRTNDDIRAAARAAGWSRARIDIALDDLHVARIGGAAA
ncbi:MAG: hypothetical protein ACEQSX_17740 [Baekduiaceae bacterium]